MSEEQGGGRVEVEQGRVAALVGWRLARSVFGVKGLCLQLDGRSRRGAGRIRAFAIVVGRLTPVSSREV